ncbi:hypothetical protein EDD37DRAFT_609797 [Exophiala viscosa]|uniref:uncharacterized protein n=1 Tax=Exophiala viscosa TaxID=2486360 RepID=UPI00219D2267|nr:hypothetical protein EDD37DRAFT_609797 [Exophiala viscosa]
MQGRDAPRDEVEYPFMTANPSSKERKKSFAPKPHGLPSLGEEESNATSVNHVAVDVLKVATPASATSPIEPGVLSPAEARSFQFFLLNTGPLLSQFSPEPQKLLEAIISSAWHCNASKNLLIALGMTDECRWTDAPSLPQDNGCAISYKTATRFYDAAVGLMAREKYSISDVLIASILAAVFELAHGEIQYVGLHLDSAVKIVQRGEGDPNHDKSRSSPEASFLRMIYIPTLAACQEFHRSRTIFSSGKLTAPTCDRQAVTMSSTLPSEFLSSAEAACSMGKCFDLLHAGNLSPAGAVFFSQNWLERARRFHVDTADLSAQRWALFIVYGTMGSSIEVICGELTEAEAQTRWNFISCQVGKISKPPGFDGLVEVLTLVSKAMGWYCKRSEPLKAARRVLEELHNR